MNFLRQLYTDLTCDASYYIITFLLGSFIIGWLTSYFANRRKIRNREETLERSKLELKQSLKLREGLQEKYDLKEADYQKAALSLIDKDKSVNTLEADKKRLNSRLQSTLDEYEKSKVEHTQTASRLEEMNDQILGLRTKNSQLNTELQQHTTTINQYADTQVDNVRLKELEHVILNLREENKVLKTETEVVASKSSDYEVLKQKIVELEAEKEQWGDNLSEITQLEDGNEALNRSIAQLMEENEAMKDRLDDLVQYESGNDILNATIMQLMEENEVLKSNISVGAVAAVPAVPTPVEATTVSEVTIVELSTDQAKAQIKAIIGSKIRFATPAEKDDLKKIQGVGPFIEEKLNDLGIYTFEQLSQLDESTIPTLTTAIEFFPGRIERDEWVNQADRLFYMKNSSSGTPVRRVISRTVVTRPNEERFVGEKKAIQEKIVVEPEKTAPQKITRVVRREPIKRVERIVRRIPLKKEGAIAPIVNKGKEVTPTPPPAPEVESISNKKEVFTPKSRSVEAIPTPQKEATPNIPPPTPAASPGLKKYVSRKIVIPPVPEAEEPIVPIAKEEMTIPDNASEDATIDELFEEANLLSEETSTIEETSVGEEIEQAKEEVEFSIEGESTDLEEVEKVATDMEPVSVEDSSAEDEISLATVTASVPEETTTIGESVTESSEEIPTTSAQSNGKDDLQVIEGIGPKISKVLNRAGIYNYAQLAAKSYEDLQVIMDDAGPRYRIARPKTWPEQAALAAAGRWEELKSLQDSL